MKQIPNPKIIKQIVRDKKLRINVARDSHEWFFVLYLGHYVKYPSAPFHEEFFALTEDEKIKLLCVVSFRGSAKSTIFTTSYALWSILGAQEKKFVIIFCQTRSQAKQHMMNLRQELENNQLLKADLGPFKEEQDSEWGASSLVFSRSGARITVASVEQSIRGLRHRESRPDLILCDDIEDLASTKTQEGRDKTYQWFVSEVVPAGDNNTRIVIVGNLLHEDALLMRLKLDIENGSRSGEFRSYPLINDKDEVLWPGKYPTEAAIEEQKKTIGSESAWQREFLLHIITDDDQIVRPEWIHHYEHLPYDGNLSDFRFTATGIDLAISEKSSADCTAMVSAKVFGRSNELRVYILPHPINERLDFPKTVDRAAHLSRTLGSGIHTKLYIENTGYQQAFVEHLRSQGLPAEEFEIKGQDKRARLTLTTSLLQAGKIIFPKEGTDLLIRQLTGFGKERHDDLADAFAILILKIMASDTGLFFDRWDKYRHVIEPGELPYRAKIFRSIHVTGKNDFTVCLWACLDTTSTITIFREYLKSGLDADQNADIIGERSERDGDIQFTVANREAFGRPGFSEGVLHIYARHDVHLSLWGSEDRDAGWNAVNYYLRENSRTKKPRLQIMSSCVHLIHAIQSASKSRDNPNDIDERDSSPLIEAFRNLVQSIPEQNEQSPLNRTQKKMLELGLNVNLQEKEDDERPLHGSAPTSSMESFPTTNSKPLNAAQKQFIKFHGDSSIFIDPDDL